MVARSAASPAATKKASSGRPCCRQVAATVSNRSANSVMPVYTGTTQDENGVAGVGA